MVQRKQIQLVSMRIQVRSLALLSGSVIQLAVSHGVGHRRGSDPLLLWLWLRPAAVALIQPPAWELSYATGAALRRKKKERDQSRLPAVLCWSLLGPIPQEPTEISKIFVNQLLNTAFVKN